MYTVYYKRTSFPVIHRWCRPWNAGHPFGCPLSKQKGDKGALSKGYIHVVFWRGVTIGVLEDGGDP